MEQNSSYQELKDILQEIQKAIEMYNGTNPDEKIALTKQEQKDVKDMFICVYNGKHVGLFKKINWSSGYYRGYSDNDYSAGSIYVGVDSNYVGMKKTHEDNISVNYWEPVGVKVVLKDKKYVSNCVMCDGMSFDDMRLIMYNNGQICPYEIGKATSQEMLEVLKYAVIYYQLNQNMQNQRKK